MDSALLSITMFVASLVLIGLATTNFASAGLSASRTQSRARQRRKHAMQHLRQAAEVARLDSELQAMGDAASTLGWRIMEVAEVVEESCDCRSYYLVDPYRQALPAFQPGQYILVRPATAGELQATRCYSLSSSPDDAYWRITVKRGQRLSDSPVQPRSGGLSRWLHAHIHAGDYLLVGGPNGQFHLASPADTPVVLLAAGVGVTPLASMMRWSLEHTPQRPVALLYQAADPTHWPLGATLHRWARHAPHAQAISYFSRSEAASLTQHLDPTTGDFRLGKFAASDALQIFPDAAAHYYLCGPEAWMETLRAELEAAGVAHEHIHWESFGGAAAAAPRDAADSPTHFQVTFAHSGTQAVWTDPEQSLWELARASDVVVPSGCLSGVCGSCRVKLLAGRVEHDRKVTLELAEDECLSCIARPLSDLRVDA